MGEGVSVISGVLMEGNGHLITMISMVMWTTLQVNGVCDRHRKHNELSILDAVFEIYGKGTGRP